MRTKDLLGDVQNTTDFDRWLERCKSELTEDDLSAYLAELMEKHGVTKTELIERANLERGYAYQILRGERAPSRDRLLQIAIGLCATLDETQRLLKLGGKGELYPRVRRDAAIIFCIGKGYSVMDTQLFLDGQALPPLKE